MAPDIPARRAETARLSQGPRTPATRKAACLQGRPHVLQLARTHLWTLWAAPFTGRGRPPGPFTRRLVWVLKLELPNHLRVQDVLSQDLSTGPYPSQFTRYWSPIPCRRERITNRIHRITVGEPWRRQTSWGQGTLMHRLHLGHVEGRVDPHGPRELEPHCRWTDDPQDEKRTHKLWHQLPGLNLKRQVPGPMAIGLSGIAAHGTREGRLSLGPRPSTLADVG